MIFDMSLVCGVGDKLTLFCHMEKHKSCVRWLYKPPFLLAYFCGYKSRFLHSLAYTQVRLICEFSKLNRLMCLLSSH